MMKKHIIVFSLLLATAFLSCDSELDVFRYDVLDANVAIQDLDDLETVLFTAYGELLEKNTYREGLLILPDLLADNLRIADASTSGITEANWQYNPEDESGPWGTLYKLIFHISTIEENVDRFEDGPKKNRILGQAKALRALAHFDLLRYYGESYDRNFEGVQSGIPIRTSFELNAPIRNTVKEVYDQVFTDLLQAQTLLGNVDLNPQQMGPYFFNQRAVTALLARVSLYAGNWQDAVDFASSVINNSSLTNQIEYPGMWTEDTDGEVLFAALFTSDADGLVGSDFNNPSNSSWNYTYTSEMAELYDANNDIRYNTFVKSNNSAFVFDQYLVTKYPGRDGQVALNNAKILRVSEQYLIRAEAYTQLINDEAAMADLNVLRANRITGYTNENLTGTSLVDAIATERRKELVAEGHRWFDLKRTGKAVIRGTDCSGATVNCSLNDGDSRFLFPIPLEEIRGNNVIKQNAGYTSN